MVAAPCCSFGLGPSGPLIYIYIHIWPWNASGFPGRSLRRHKGMSGTPCSRRQPTSDERRKMDGWTGLTIPSLSTVLFGCPHLNFIPSEVTVVVIHRRRRVPRFAFITFRDVGKDPIRNKSELSFHLEQMGAVTRYMALWRKHVAHHTNV